MKLNHIHLFNRKKDNSETPIFEKIGPGSTNEVRLYPSLAVTLGSATLAGRLAKAAFEIPAPVKAVASMSAKSGAAGAIVDACLGGYNALGPLTRGEIDLKQVSIHVVSEGVCGFLTAGAGTAGSISAYMLTGSLGPVVIASGMASSMAVRWGYRQVVGDTLPENNDNNHNNHKDDTFENIGPED